LDAKLLGFRVGFCKSIPDMTDAPHVHAPSRPRAALAALAGLAARGADVLMPPACLACHTPIDRHHALCARCWASTTFIRAPLCDVTGIPLPFGGEGPMVSARALVEPPAYDRARAVAHHAGAMRRLVHRFKYADSHEARPLFARWLAEAGRDLLADADVIVPVPMGRWRLILRRYNQAAILAREVARLSGVPMAPLALARARKASRQVGLTRAQRRDNVAGVFRVPSRRRAEVEGRRVLLIDDVVTTGATVEACARVLKRAGATRVDVLALALVCDGAPVSP
jgi:ComF family protein